MIDSLAIDNEHPFRHNHTHTQTRSSLVAHLGSAMLDRLSPGGKRKDRLSLWMPFPAAAVAAAAGAALREGSPPSAVPERGRRGKGKSQVANALPMRRINYEYDKRGAVYRSNHSENREYVYHGRAEEHVE